MNKELIKKYKKEFEHWLNGGMLHIKVCDGCWYKSDKFPEPMSLFNDRYKIVIDDEYVEFRKALAEGKTIQSYCDIEKDFFDCTILDGAFNLEVKDYRIKPDKPKFPCYFKEKSSGIVVKFEKDNRDGSFSPTGIVVESTYYKHPQKTLGFKWKCWDTFSHPERWEYLSEYKKEPQFKVGDWVKPLSGKAPLKIARIPDRSTTCYEDKDILDDGRGYKLYSNEVELWEPEENKYCWHSLYGFIYIQRKRDTSYYDALLPFRGNTVTIEESNCEPFIGDIPSFLKDKKCKNS